VKKNFKKLASALLAAFMLLALAACGAPPSSSAPQSGSDPAKTPAAPANESDSASGDTGDKIIIKLGHGNGSSDTDMINCYANEFKRLAAEYSDGELEVQVYPSSQLGDESEMYGACGLNTLEATIGATTNYAAYAPIMNFTVLPYVFKDLESCRTFFVENIDWMNEYCVPQANSRILGFAVGGMRSLASAKHISSIDDVKGMKVRVPPTKPMIEFWTAVGASPQVVAWAETYTSIEQGVADAVCGNEWILIDNKFGEVCDYFVYIDYMPQPNALVMSEEFYQSLSEKNQEAVTRAGAEAALYFMELADKMKVAYREQAETEMGVEFLDTPSDIDTWIELGRSTWEKSYEAIGNGDAEAGKQIMDYVLGYSEK